MCSLCIQAALLKQEDRSVTSLEHAELQNGFHNRTQSLFHKDVLGFVKKTFYILELEVSKLRHDPTELLTRALQPALWMLVFGEVFSNIRAIPTGSLSYLDFMAPGILAQSVLFVSIFYGIAVIWERDLGIIHKFLVSPTPRAALVLGKALSAGVRGLSQAIIIYLLSFILGVHLNWSISGLSGILLFVFLGSALFSTFSLIVACIVKTRERFMGIGQIMTMPLFFASNAIYPIGIMPVWLKVIAHLNPLTYVVDALRGLMLAGGESLYGFRHDFIILAASTTILVLVGAWFYPRVVS
jgi:ABC-2 type transport system permease protein